MATTCVIHCYNVNLLLAGVGQAKYNVTKVLSGVTFQK